MKDIQGLIESLQGTCMKTIDEEKVHFGWGKDEELTDEELSEIDNCIFQCDCCGWWCETSEEGNSGDGERICRDCSDNDEDWEE